MGPQLAVWRANVMTGGQQSFPAWLEIAFSDALCLCEGLAPLLSAQTARLIRSSLIPPLPNHELVMEDQLFTARSSQTG